MSRNDTTGDDGRFLTRTPAGVPDSRWIWPERASVESGWTCGKLRPESALSDTGVSTKADGRTREIWPELASAEGDWTRAKLRGSATTSRCRCKNSGRKRDGFRYSEYRVFFRRMAAVERIGPERAGECGCDEIIDVRSPREYAEDHLEGARSLPVLSDEERERIGSLYRAHPFQARRAGAALIAGNVARHLDEYFSEKPPSYRPLLYCWRGGQRSESLGTILAAVGWRVLILEGGYKAYRAYLLRDFDRLMQERGLSFRIIAGLTGSGKTALLRWMADNGRQVLDLEGLARHRGSILGDRPDVPQPTQKRFENLLWQALRRMQPDRPVYVESESNRIGSVHVPAPLWESLREAEVVEIEVPRAERARFLVSEYAHFVNDPGELLARIHGLRGRVGGARVQEWEDRIACGDWEGLAAGLLEQHYDPAYLRSRARIFREPVLKLHMEEVSSPGFAEVAAALTESEDLGKVLSRIRC